MFPPATKPLLWARSAIALAACFSVDSVSWAQQFNPPPLVAAQANPAAEAAKAIERLNAIRANPAKFSHLHASLADGDVESRPALTVSKALMAAAQRKAQWMAANERDDNSHFAHVITIDGAKIGMNGWMRAAGYPLAPYLKDEETAFECLSIEFGGAAGIGERVIDRFLAEGKNGGHVLPIMGRGFWTPCKDIGVGVAVSSTGKAYFSVLVAIYDPFNPNAVGAAPREEAAPQPRGEPSPAPAAPAAPGEAPPAPSGEVNPAAGAPQALVSLLPQEKALFDILNAARAKRMAPPFVFSTKLYSAASKHAVAMVKKGDLVSVFKDGKTADDRAQAEGYRSKVVEYITPSSYGDVSTAEKLWKLFEVEAALPGAPELKILDPKNTEIGISYTIIPGRPGIPGDDGVVWVMVFGSSPDAANPPRIEVFTPK